MNARKILQTRSGKRFREGIFVGKIDSKLETLTVTLLGRVKQ